jgi:hypothetical protein
VIQLNHTDYGDSNVWGEDALNPLNFCEHLFKNKSKFYFTRTKFQARPLPEY